MTPYDLSRRERNCTGAKIKPQGWALLAALYRGERPFKSEALEKARRLADREKAGE